jgi:arabinogalactan endo-1,4-beta-galactosidase
MKILLKWFIILLILVVSLNCKKNKIEEVPVPVINTNLAFIKGADVSWISEMEAAGIKFYDIDGVEQDLFLLLKNLGFNAIRLRIWVNPSNGWNNTTDVITKALRAKSQGMKILLDFHYSDTWADPAHQSKPAAWEGINFNVLKDSLKSHTENVLLATKNAQINPEWVQIGNETNDGVLWPDGKASTNMSNFAELIATGYQAAKTIFPNTKVIVHVSNGWDNNLFRWMFDGLKNNNAQWDVIGMSLYPEPGNWSTLNAQCLSNMNDMVARYNKEVMIVEVGMSWDQASISKSFISDIISKTKSVTNNKGLGVFYWEPQSYNNWNSYTLGAFDNTGKPTEALNAFK